MPLVFEKKVGNNSKIGLWQIGENSEELLSHLNYEVNPDILNVNENLKKQRIAARILVNKLLGSVNEINYDSYNKPYLSGSSTKISISHAHSRVAVIVNKANETGVDIELIKPRIENIASRFLSEKELISIDDKRRIEQLTTYWCAKETLYKYYGKKELLFSKNIFIDSFKQGDTGKTTGHIQTTDINISLSLCYEKTGDFMLVYVND